MSYHRKIARFLQQNDDDALIILVNRQANVFVVLDSATWIIYDHDNDS
jgi:hypothetical protein